MKATFKKTVDSRDLEGVRLSLSNEMMLDPRGESFIEMRQYAETMLPQLYDAHNGENLDMNQDNWNEDLLFSTKNDLDNNFSKERLDYYFDMAKIVLKENADKLNREQKAVVQNKDPHTYRSSSNADVKANPLYVGAAIGGLIVGGSGLILGKTVITVVGLAAAAISGGILYNESKKQR